MTSGMGRAAAIAFAREGADVAINHLPRRSRMRRRSSTSSKLKAERHRDSRRYPGRGVLQAAGRGSREGLGGLDILVSNAGQQQTRASILDVSTEDFDATMKTNIYAPFWIIKAALPHLKPGSTIVATASEQAYDPSPDLYDYAQTKAATMNYVKSLAKQLASKGIRVNAVAPGPIWTPLQVSGGATHGKAREVRKSRSARPSWPAGGTSFDLRPTRCQRRELCDRAGLWVVGRRGSTMSWLTFPPRSRAR